MCDVFDMLLVDIVVVFCRWNEGKLNSYLIEISVDVLE